MTEKPSDVIQEDLSFVSWNDKFPKQVKRKLSRWIKGYIKERLEFKCDVLGIKHHKVNAAYTSQVCYKCHYFGKRNDDVFTCSNCGNMHADINASHNIKSTKKRIKKLPFLQIIKRLKRYLKTE